MSDIVSRLKTKRIERKMSQAKLAEAMGWKQSRIGNYESGSRDIPERALIELADFYGVSVDWLKNGTSLNSIENSTISNSSVISGSNTITYKNAEIKDSVEVGTDNDMIVLDVLDIEASAGFGSQNGDIVQIISQLRYVPEQFYQYYAGITPKNTRIINVKGDSMRPTFEPGDLLFVDISITGFDGDGIYVFTFDNSLFVKRVQKIGRSYLIISDNKSDAQYINWEIKPEDRDYVHFHGKVKVHQSQKLNYFG